MLAVEPNVSASIKPVDRLRASVILETSSFHSSCAAIDNGEVTGFVSRVDTSPARLSRDASFIHKDPKSCQLRRPMNDSGSCPMAPHAVDGNDGQEDAESMHVV